VLSPQRGVHSARQSCRTEGAECMEGRARAEKRRVARAVPDGEMEARLFPKAAVAERHRMHVRIPECVKLMKAPRGGRRRDAGNALSPRTRRGQCHASAMPNGRAACMVARGTGPSSAEGRGPAVRLGGTGERPRSPLAGASETTPSPEGGTGPSATGRNFDVPVTLPREGGATTPAPTGESTSSMHEENGSGNCSEAQFGGFSTTKPAR
jgi:hypothetical protein